MKLTPLEIRHKEFGRSMRGYKDIDVDEFLDDVADEFERLFNENIDHKERLEALEEKIEQYRNIEETLKKTLLSAQQQAEELKHNAKKESDLILRDAELKSRSILNDSYAERQKIQRSVQALKQKQEELRYQLRSVLESYMNILDQDSEVVFDDSGEASSVTGPADVEDEAAGAPATADSGFTGIDEAVSDEFLSADGPDSFGVEETAAEPAPSDPPDSDEEPAPSAPPDPAASTAATEDDEEDPFADVETDSEEREFKW